MASNFFRQFAIDNNLTVDYGFTYGRYNDFFIAVKESSFNRTLYISTDLAQDKEKLKQVLSCYTNLEEYHIINNTFEKKYISFTFNLPNDKVSLVIEFLDKFIESYKEFGLVPEIKCYICGETIKADDKMSIMDYQGTLFPIHDSCFNKNEEALKEEVEEQVQEINKGRLNYFVGALGAIVFSLIYIVLFIGVFYFAQFLMGSISGSSDIPFENVSMSIRIFQYIPCLTALAASPLINIGYESFRGKQGNGKFLIILFTCIITTLIGIISGFTISLTLAGSTLSLKELFKLVFELIVPSAGYKSFRSAFYIYIFLGVALSLVSLLFTFTKKKEVDKANTSTFEKLE